jgi:heat shock protein HslJ
MKYTGNSGIPGFIFPVVSTLLIPFILAAGCTGEPDVHLEGTRWILTGYVKEGIPAQPLDGTGITLDFGTDNRIGGSAGCNLYFASYEVSGTGISIGQAGSTEMYCSTPGVMEQESTYLVLLGTVQSVTVDDNHLILSDAQGTPVLSYAKIVPSLPEEHLIGTTWRLESFHTEDTVSSVLSGITISAVFEEDGRVIGSAGCNTYFARYNLTGNQLSISTIGTTKMNCGTPGVMEQENTYLALLGKVTTFTIEGERMSVADAGSATLLSYTKAPLTE